MRWTSTSRRYLPQLALAAIVPVAVLIVLAASDWVAAAIVLATLPLVPLFMALVGAATRERTDAQLAALQRLGGHFLDVVAGLPTLKVFGRAKAQAAAIATLTDRHREHALGTLRIAFLSSLVLELLSTLSMALVAVAVGLRLLGGGARLPDRAARAHPHARGLPAAAAARRELPRRRRGSRGRDADPRRARRPRRASARAPRPPAGAPISVDGPAGHAPRDRARRAVADRRGRARSWPSAGPSGGGKSTLLRVLLGLERPPRAACASAARTWASSTSRPGTRGSPGCRSARTCSPARSPTTSGSAAPDASPEAVWRALADARLAGRGGRGCPTACRRTLGERGAGLSAGERQRVALARAFLRDAPLLLLDEPTAGLDGATEAEVMRAVRRLVRGRTVVLVAHRPALLALADRVVDLAPAEVAA